MPFKFKNSFSIIFIKQTVIFLTIYKNNSLNPQNIQNKTIKSFLEYIRFIEIYLFILLLVRYK